MFKDIISLKNLRSAYLALEEKYVLKGTFKKLKGIDGISLWEFKRDLKNNLNLLHKELTNSTYSFLPLLKREIPKKHSKGTRTIYQSTIRDRIVYQAIYQTLEPMIEKILSPNLYSYRKTRTNYQGIKNIRRIILNESSKYYLLKLDFKDYTDHLNHEILLSKFKDLGCDKKTLELIATILKQNIFTETTRYQQKAGIVQGIALCSISANLYLNNLDHQLSATPNLIYQRVGDDIIILSEKKKDLESALKIIKTESKKLHLQINKSKTVLQKASEKFEYLGLEMDNDQVRLTPKNLLKMKKWFKAKFNKNRKVTPASINRLIYSGTTPQALNWLRYYHLITDVPQLRALDHFIRNRICIALTGKNTGQAHRQLRQEISFNTCYTSFVNFFHRITHGRQNLKQLNYRHKLGSSN